VTPAECCDVHLTADCARIALVAVLLVVLFAFFAGRWKRS
jgi:hypothetical protein